MKRFVLSLIIVLTGVSIATSKPIVITSSTPTAKDVLNVSSFTQIEKSGWYYLTLIPSDEEKVEVFYSEPLREYIYGYVKGDKLYMGIRDFDYKIKSGGIVLEFRVYFKKLDEISMGGNGTVKMKEMYDTKGENFKLKKSGTGNFFGQLENVNKLSVILSGSGTSTEVQGSANTLSVILSGSGGGTFKNLFCRNVECILSGSGSLSVFATENLSGTLSGSGSIYAYGNPKKEITRSGSGSIYYYDMNLAQKGLVDKYAPKKQSTSTSTTNQNQSVSTYAQNSYNGSYSNSQQTSNTQTTSAQRTNTGTIQNQNQSQAQAASKPSYTLDIDVNVPQISTVNENTFVLIISNENYKELAKVSYALRDGEIFYKYCTQTLGIPKDHIRFYKDATYGDMLGAIDRINNIAKAYKSEGIDLIVYYAGHGAPNDATKEAYLIPIDAFNVNTKGCYALKDFYADLAAMKAKHTMVFLDACFSGSVRAGNGEMLASARGVAISSKNETLNGSLVVLSATNGSETALPYEEQKHGLFTYFLLKKLQETKGNVSMGELSEYIKTKVGQQSVVTNDKAQTPTINASSTANGWEYWKLGR